MNATPIDFKSLNIKLIASDLDGTLLYPQGTQELNPETFPLVRELCERGVVFVASSGRQYYNLQLLFDSVKDDIAYICENGCLCVYKGKEIYANKIERRLADSLSEDILAAEGSELLVSCPDMQYVIPKDPSFFFHMRDVVRVRVTEVKSISDIPDPVIKVSSYGTKAVLEESKWKEKYDKVLTVQTAGVEWLDFAPLGVNKAVALEHLLDYLNIKPQECMAFGDNENDRAILEYVGLPVTMNSSNPSVLSLGRFTTDSVNDVLRNFLDQK